MLFEGVPWPEKAFNHFDCLINFWRLSGFVFSETLTLFDCDSVELGGKNYQGMRDKPRIDFRSSSPEVFCKKGVLRNFGKFTGKYLCQSLFFNKVAGNFIEIVLRHGCSPVNLRHIFRTSFPKNTYGWLVLKLVSASF